MEIITYGITAGLPHLPNRGRDRGQDPLEVFCQSANLRSFEVANPSVQVVRLYKMPPGRPLRLPFTWLRPKAIASLKPRPTARSTDPDPALPCTVS